jgi:triosephosphate isomerase
MRIPLIGANWKMHKNPKGTTALFETFLPLVKSSVDCEIVICPTLLLEWRRPDRFIMPAERVL